MSQSPEDLSQKITLVDGQMFEGRFQIISVLGQGGVGVVYKAKQTHMNKLVAIKTLMSSVVSGDAASFKRFEQEAQAASSLNHPNIISIFDFGKSADGLAYLVMEYLSGTDLDDVLETEKRLGPDRFLRIAVQICDGLQHAHRKGVIHRDIKPTNIMLVDTEDAADTVKIVDFGLAKLTAIESEKHLTQTGTIVGTPLYMSPEQCRGLELDHRSDIYSLGCVLYTALTGKEPIHGTTALDTLYKHTAEPPTPFNVACPGLNLPPRLEHVILKTLQKEPDQRHQSMTELRNDITDAIYYRSYNSGITAGGVGSLAALAGENDAPRASGLSQTLNVSHGPSPQPELSPSLSASAAASPSPSQKAETDKGGHQSPAGKDGATMQTLRGTTDTAKDHVVVSKPAFIAGCAVAVLAVVGAVAAFLNAKQISDIEHPPTSAQTAASTQTQTQAPPLASNQTPASSQTQASTQPLSPGVVPPAGKPSPSATTLAPKKPPAKPSTTAPAKPDPRSKAHPPRPSTATLSPAAPPPKPKTHPQSQQLASIEPQVRKPATTPDQGQSGVLMNDGIKLGQVHKFEREAHSLFAQGNWPAAESNYISCLQLQTQLLGSGNAFLFPNLAHLVGCQLEQHKMTQATENLLWAQRIFNEKPQKVLELVSHRKDQIDIWGPLARASREVAQKNHDPRYWKWCASFYELDLDAWKGRPDDDRYRSLAQEYCTALDNSGDKPKAFALRKELNLPQPQPPLKKASKPHRRAEFWTGDKKSFGH